MHRPVQTDLELAIDKMPMADTHEHLRSEAEWVESGPDILGALFDNYVTGDFNTAIADPNAIRRLLQDRDGDVARRFRDIEPDWERVRHTGYGEAVALAARHVYGIEELSPAALAAASDQHAQLRRPGGRLRLMRDVAGLTHVQTDNHCWPCLPDPSGPEFFYYDLSWRRFCNGDLALDELEQETGIAVNSLDGLRDAMAALFAKYGPCAIAVKSQHAYNRTLLWCERSDGEIAPIFNQYRRDPQSLSAEQRLALGDWAWARGVELAIAYDLPFKLHTGYYVGNYTMVTDRISTGQLAPLLMHYRQARFVLMHIGYPYSDEIVAVAKHFPNTWVDLCWAWSIDPYSSMQFVRRFLHAVPANKLLGFGGDTAWPTGAVGYAFQARHWLARTLAAEVEAGSFTERDAIALAGCIMHENAEALFPIEATREAILGTGR